MLDESIENKVIDVLKVEGNSKAHYQLTIWKKKDLFDLFEINEYQFKILIKLGFIVRIGHFGKDSRISLYVYTDYYSILNIKKGIKRRG